MKFIPALLTDSKNDLISQLKRLLPYFNHFSLDITDGLFVPHRSLQIQEIADVLHTIDEKELSNMIFDFDLMVNNYSELLPLVQSLSDSVHVHNVFIRERNPVLLKDPIIREYTYSIGLAIEENDQMEYLAQYKDLNSIPALQIMTIQSGSQGNPMIPDMLNKIGVLKSLYYKNSIYIDGGVNSNSMKDIMSLKQRPDYVCVGSYLSQTGDDFEDHVKYLKGVEATVNVDSV